MVENKRRQSFIVLRFNHDGDGEIGYYDVENPWFTFMPQESKKFHVFWCKYDQSFKAFYDRCVEVMDACDTSKILRNQAIPEDFLLSVTGFDDLQGLASEP